MSAAQPQSFPQPYEVVCSVHDRALWLEERRKTLGASETPGVLGESPYDSPLSVYESKVLPPDDAEPEEHMWWGLHLEEPIARGYGLRTRRRVDQAGIMLRSTVYPWLSCSLDAWTGIDGLNWWPLEVKNISGCQIDEWETQSPRHIYLQTQQQMLVTGAPRVTVAALVGGSRLMWEDIEPDKNEQLRILALTKRFWDECVLAGVEPKADGTEATKRALRNLHPADNGNHIKLGNEWLPVDEERERLREEIKPREKRLDEINNLLRQQIGDATYAYLSDGTSYSWKTGKVARTLRRHAPKRR